MDAVDVTELRQEVEGLKAKVSSLTTENQQLRNQIENTLGDCNAIDGALIDSIKKNVELRKGIFFLEKQANNLRSRISNLEAEKKTLDDNSKQLQDEIARLKSQPCQPDGA